MQKHGSPLVAAEMVALSARVEEALTHLKASSQAFQLGLDQEAKWLDRVKSLHAVDLADLIQRLRPNYRFALLDSLGEALDPEIFPHLDQGIRHELMAGLGSVMLGLILAKLETDDAIDLLADLDSETLQSYLNAVPQADRHRIKAGLQYPEESAGRLMRPNFVAVPQEWSVGETIDHLRRRSDLPDDFFNLFVVDTDGIPCGHMPVSRVIRSRRPIRVLDLVDPEMHLIPTDMDQEEVALWFRRYGLVEVAIVDAQRRLVGTVTVDDVVDVIHEEAEEDILRLAGAHDVNIYNAVWKTYKTRITWLLVNLVTALLASIVISQFEESILRLVSLVALMPVVAAMGGNAGMQSLAVVIRALAMKQLEGRNWRVLGREAMVGLMNGISFAILAGGLAGLWFDDPFIGLVAAAALIVTLSIACVSGAGIPILLHRLGLDPAISSSVFLITITDSVGFLSFLGLATLFLL